MAQQHRIQPWPTVVHVSRQVFYEGRLSPLRLTPNLDDQVSVCMAPGDRVAQLYT